MFLKVPPQVIFTARDAIAWRNLMIIADEMEAIGR
jgi:hypothetical protein